MVYLKFVENVITLGKLIGLLFLFCLPLLSILFLKTKRNNLARPVMGTIFLVCLKFVATDFFLKIISPSAGENSGDLRSPCYSAVSTLLMNPLPDRSNYSSL